jgi:hypothetical protein
VRAQSVARGRIARCPSIGKWRKRRKASGQDHAASSA